MLEISPLVAIFFALVVGVVVFVLSIVRERRAIKHNVERAFNEHTHASSPGKKEMQIKEIAVKDLPPEVRKALQGMGMNLPASEETRHNHGEVEQDGHNLYVSWVSDCECAHEWSVHVEAAILLLATNIYQGVVERKKPEDKRAFIDEEMKLIVSAVQERLLHMQTNPSAMRTKKEYEEGGRK